MISYGRLCFLLPLLLVCGLAGAQELRWHSDIGEAQSEASTSNREILIFFSGPGMLSTHYKQLFEQREVQKQLGRFVLARLDILDNRAYAQQLAVTQPGVILVYSATGQGLKRIEAQLSASELVAQLQPKSVPKIYPPVPTTPPTVAAVQKAPVKLAKGAKIKGPVTVSITSPNTIDLGTLEKDRWYILEVEGQNNPWGDEGFRADSFFIFNRKTPPSTNLEPWVIVRFKDGDMSLASYAEEVTGKAIEYSKDHRYQVPICGTGKNVVLYIWERQQSHYKDNTGEVTVTVYGAKR
jgi:hypothetical protein